MVKLGSNVLRRVISYLHRGDPRCLIGPRIGEDAAVIDSKGIDRIVIHTDPITGAERLIGTLSVIVPSNDVSCEGGDPRWLSISILLPEFYPEDRLLEICTQIRDSCNRFNIDIVGGHTEYTPSLSRPIIVSTCIGTCRKPLDKRKISENDFIILARSPGIEAALVLVTDMRDRLKSLDTDTVRRIESFINDLAIIGLARKVRDYVKAMHDPTEGGILQALFELSRACSRDIEIWLSEIRIREEVSKVCKDAGIDPLRSLSSGSLLVIVDKENLQTVLDILRKETNGEANIIGRVRERSSNPCLYVLEHEKGRVAYTVCEDIADQVMSIFSK